MNPKTHIRVRCDCGAILMAPAQLAGRSACCGSCGAEVDIPMAPIRDRQKDAGVSPANQSPVYKSSHRGEEAGEHSRKELQSRRKRRQRAAAKSAGGTLKDSSWWLKSLRFPFRTESLITIGVLSVLYGTIVSPATRFTFLLMASRSGRFISVLVIGYFIYFLLDVLRTAAHGEEDLPVAVDWSREEVIGDLFLAAGVIAICFLPWGAYRMLCFWDSRDLDATLDSLLMSVPMFYFPMALLSATIHHSFLAVNPVTVLPAIGVTFVDYVVVLVLIAIGCALNWGISYFTSELLLAGIAAWWSTFTGMTMAMHALGSLYRRNSSRLAWLNER